MLKFNLMKYLNKMRNLLCAPQFHRYYAMQQFRMFKEDGSYPHGRTQQARAVLTAKWFRDHPEDERMWHMHLKDQKKNTIVIGFFTHICC